MATDRAVTGPSVWLQLVRQEVENADIDNAGDNAGAFSNGFTDPFLTDFAHHSDTNNEDNLVLPSLELGMENIAIDNTKVSIDVDFGDPTFTSLADSSDTSSEEDLAIGLPPMELELDSNGGIHRVGSPDEEEHLVLPPIAVPRSVEDNGFDALYHGPLVIIRDESEDDGNVTHMCRNGCDRDDENTDTVSSLDALVELGCQCRGSMSRMCIKCLLKWFGPRIMLEKDTTCEVCQTRMNESVKKTVLRALADHTGGREILIEALGPPLVRAHNAREGLGRMDPVVEEDDDMNVNVNELPDAAPNGAALVSFIPEGASPHAPPRAPPATPGSPSAPAPDSRSTPHSPGSGLLVPAPIQRQRLSIWTKMRHYMCCATPTSVLGPH